MSRLRLILVGALSLALLVFSGARILSCARPCNIIQNLQPLPACMQSWKSLPPGTWLGSHRRWIAFANGRFTGEVGSWWDAVPPPSAPPAVSGVGGRSGVAAAYTIYFRTVPGAFDNTGAATGTVAEWALPLWLPTLLILLALGALLLPELLLALTFRARRRTRLGLCAHCGYDRAGLQTHIACPECGHAPTTV